MFGGQLGVVVGMIGGCLEVAVGLLWCSFCIVWWLFSSCFGELIRGAVGVICGLLGDCLGCCLGIVCVCLLIGDCFGVDWVGVGVVCVLL